MQIEQVSNNQLQVTGGLIGLRMLIGLSFSLEYVPKSE